MLNSIQFLRALAAWVVVGHHFVQIFYGGNNVGFVENFLWNYGTLGVDLFFVISGFVIYHATVDRVIPPARFFSLRLIRVIPAYWVFSLLTALLVYSFQGLIPFTQLETGFLLKSLAFIPWANPSGIGYFPLLTPGWTLNFEVAFYSIFGLTLFFSSRYRVLLVMLGLFLLQSVVPNFGVPWDFYKNKIIFEFVLGIGVAIIYRRELLKHVKTGSAMLLLLLAVIAIAVKGNGHHYLYVGIPCAFVMIAALSQEYFFRKYAIFNTLGNQSYSTYLCHVIILSIAYYFFKTYDLPIGIVVILTILGVFMVSVISFSFIEQLSSRWLKERFFRVRLDPKVTLP